VFVSFVLVKSITKTPESVIIHGCREVYSLMYEVSLIVSSVYGFPIMIVFASIYTGTRCNIHFVAHIPSTESVSVSLTC
jgi:hypothetical protein